MDTFTIESYKVRVEIDRIGDPVRTIRNRIIEVESTPMFHGIVVRGLFSFSINFDSWSSTQAAGFFQNADPARPRLIGWFPSDEFPYWYDILRSESPVHVTYDIRQIGGANCVRRIGVGSSTEPVGEGPADADA